MKASIAAIISFAAVAMAGAVRRNAPSGVQPASDSCGSQVLSCCNSSDQEDSTGVISAIVGPVLGDGCAGIGVNAISLLSPFISTADLCGDNTISCCDGNKDSGIIVVDAQCAAL